MKNFGDPNQITSYSQIRFNHIINHQGIHLRQR